MSDDVSDINLAQELLNITSQANQRRKEEARKNLEKELEPIIKKCKEAAADGKYEIDIKQESISKKAINALKQKGLRVSNLDTQYTTITISWNK